MPLSLLPRDFRFGEVVGPIQSKWPEAVVSPLTQPSPGDFVFKVTIPEVCEVGVLPCNRSRQIQSLVESSLCGGTVGCRSVTPFDWEEGYPSVVYSVSLYVQV